MPPLAYRRLDRRVPADVQALQGVLAAAPGYHLLVEGRLPAPTAAEDLLSELPPGAAGADKFVLGISAEGRLIGCADLLRGHPEPGTAYLGLFLFDEAHQGRGYGPLALADLEARAASWGCRHLRLAVIATNTRALAFWRREGFGELYRKPMPAYTGEAIVLQRPLRPGSGATAAPARLQP